MIVGHLSDRYTVNLTSRQGDTPTINPRGHDIIWGEHGNTDRIEDHRAEIPYVVSLICAEPRFQDLSPSNTDLNCRKPRTPLGRQVARPHYTDSSSAGQCQHRCGAVCGVTACVLQAASRLTFNDWAVRIVLDDPSIWEHSPGKRGGHAWYAGDTLG